MRKTHRIGKVKPLRPSAARASCPNVQCGTSPSFQHKNHKSARETRHNPTKRPQERETKGENLRGLVFGGEGFIEFVGGTPDWHRIRGGELEPSP